MWDTESRAKVKAIKAKAQALANLVLNLKVRVKLLETKLEAS